MSDDVNAALRNSGSGDAVATGDCGHALAIVGAETQSHRQALDGEPSVALSHQVSDEVPECLDRVMCDSAGLIALVIDQGRDVRRVTGSR